MEAAQQNPLKDQEDSAFAMGQQALQSGQLAEAIQHFKTVLNFNMDRQAAHYQLGVLYLNTGDMEAAIDHFQFSTALLPSHMQSWINLGHARVFAGRLKEALSAARIARGLAGPEHKNDAIYMKLLAKCIQPSTNFEINRYFVEEVTSCFQSPDVNKTPIVDVAQQIFLEQDVVKALLENLDNGRIRDFESLLQDQNLNWPVFNHPLFTIMLAKTVVWAEPIENLMTALRAHILEMVAEGNAETKLWPDALSFVAALAQQCWINDYLYALTAEEKEQLKTIETRASFEPFETAVLGCYRRLYQQDYADTLLGNSDPLLSDVLRVQISEPREEEEIKGKLEELTSIDDEISLIVKEQYETFPYPRWIDTAIERPVTLAYLLNNQFPALSLEHLPPADLSPEILIAGCGTGRQAVENALLLQNSNITAIDITASSLAYAVRKTQELGMGNIRYGLADILKLEELGQSFDLVMCGGVLHHMQDPMAGWKVLDKITKPGGFMSIALYSEIARRYIAQAQDLIDQQGITNDEAGIREFRAQIKQLPDSNPLKGLIDHRDFYSIPECRDMLFHVQEHRFTALSLEKSMDELGLEFLGFQNLPANVRSDYKKHFPEDAHLTDLKNWHEFEMQNPTIFKGMYQFWCRKP